MRRRRKPTTASNWSNAASHRDVQLQIDTVRGLIGQDAGTSERREPTPEQMRRGQNAEEEQRAPGEAANGGPRHRKNREARGADHRLPTARRKHARRNLFARRAPHRRKPLGMIQEEQPFEDVDTSVAAGANGSTSTNPTLTKPLHPFNGQYLPAIIGIQTDPVTAERTGGNLADLPSTKGPRSARRCRCRRRRPAGDCIRLSPGRRKVG